MTPGTLAWVALLAAAIPASRYERPVQLDGSNSAEICVALPADLVAHAAPGLRDLRVVADGREIAYRLRVSGEDAAAESARVQQIVNLGERNGAVSFDVEMTPARYSRVVLRLGRPAFSILVHVSGVDRPGETGVAFPEFAWSSSDAAEGTEQRVITLPESSFHYLHFELKTLALEPVRPQDLAGVDVLSQRPEPVRYIDVARAAPPQQKPHHSLYAFALPANLPVERLRFASEDPRAIFTRDATLARPDTGPEASGETQTIALVQTAKREPAGETPGVEVSLPAVPRVSQIALTLDNGDDAPLSLTSLQLQMRERQVCFLRSSGVSYALRYGNASLTAPQYDLSPIDAAAGTSSMSMLGAERVISENADTDPRPFTERHPVMLWAALILVVGTLGAVALRSARG